MRATMLLCDAAQEVGGKLYIIGGGWSVRNVPGPVLMAVAIKVYVGWNEANEERPFVLRLVTQDGQPVDAGKGPVEVSGSMNIGRPAGVRPGSDLDTAMAIMFSFELGAGAYRFEFEIDGTPLAQESFVVKPLATGR